MAAPKRSPTQREKDLLEISRLYLSGKIQAEIAEVMGTSQQQVSYDLGILRGRWQKAANANIDEIKARELAKIDRLELEYWDAWRRSLEEFRSKTVKAKGATPELAKASAEQTLRTEDRNGDPRYLEGVRWCIERRCKILGIDAPIRQELSGKDGGPLTINVIYDESDGTSETSA